MSIQMALFGFRQRLFPEIEVFGEQDALYLELDITTGVIKWVIAQAEQVNQVQFQVDPVEQNFRLKK